MTTYYLDPVAKTQEKNNAGSYLYLYECFCGNTFKATCTQIKTGRIKSCEECHTKLKQGRRDQKHSLVGLTFADWKVLRKEGNDKNGFALYLCECLCGSGETKILRGISLKQKQSYKSCKMCTTPKSIEVGSKFGKLTIIKLYKKEVSTGKNRTICDAICDCGKIVSRRADCLKPGSSCGCGRREIARKNMSNPETREKLSKIFKGRDSFWARGIKKNLIGTQLGNLTVVRLIELKNSRAFYSCECSCGTKEVVIRGDSSKRSCGICHLKNYGFTGERWSSKLRAKLVRLSKYRKWKNEIKKRDGYSCVLCGETKKIHVDHIKSFSCIIYENKIKNTIDAMSCPDLWDTKNGRVLCETCHKKTLSYGRRV